MDIHEIGGNAVYGLIGIVLGLLVKYIWDKINKNYVTEENFKTFMEKHILTCDARKLLLDTQTTNDIQVIRKIVLKLAAKTLPVDQYEDLTK